MTKINKSLVALSVIGALFTGSALAGEQVKIYGKVNASVQYDSADENETNVKSNASRVGLKGGVKINDNLSAIYKVEWQVDVADEGSNIKGRNQWVGLKGNFGSVMLGRNDSALKQSQGSIDLFNDLEADIKVLFSGENRLDDSVSYVSPTFSGFRFLASWMTENNSASEGKNGTSLALAYGDKKLKKSALYASVALDSKITGRDTTRVTVQGKLGEVKLGAMWNQSEKIDGSSKGDGFLVNAAYSLNKTTFKLQFQDGDDKYEGKVWTLGVDQKLADNVKAYGFYTDKSFESKQDSDHFGIGLVYKF